jgi:hypothetical protein
MTFQKIVDYALSANYVGSDWFDEFSSLRFTTEIVNRNEIVATTLAKHGHLYTFSTSSALRSKLETRDCSDNEGDSRRTTLRFQEDLGELEELTAGADLIEGEPSDNIMSWLTKVYKNSRGFKLGIFNSSLLVITMKTQSSNWEAISISYI